MTDLLSGSDIDDLLVLERGEGLYVFDTHGPRSIGALLPAGPADLSRPYRILHRFRPPAGCRGRGRRG